ncbi:hypothetical protein PVAG01_05512 [Phlyctema vagabunda]|uniref:Uncharacterized protein n=1 Tax=Phlyctema vagabunda TaxID=108571 RepID=A0ABR4PK93_9HELO
MTICARTTKPYILSRVHGISSSTRVCGRVCSNNLTDGMLYR